MFVPKARTVHDAGLHHAYKEDDGDEEDPQDGVVPKRRRLRKTLFVEDECE